METLIYLQVGTVLVLERKFRVFNQYFSVWHSLEDANLLEFVYKVEVLGVVADA
jgi:hypothetical protein